MIKIKENSVAVFFVFFSSSRFEIFFVCRSTVVGVPCSTFALKEKLSKILVPMKISVLSLSGQMRAATARCLTNLFRKRHHNVIGCSSKSDQVCLPRIYCKKDYPFLQAYASICFGLSKKSGMVTLYMTSQRKSISKKLFCGKNVVILASQSALFLFSSAYDLLCFLLLDESGADSSKFWAKCFAAAFCL